MLKTKKEEIAKKQCMIKYLKEELEKAKRSNYELRNENEDCYLKIYKQSKLILDIQEEVGKQQYGSIQNLINKIKELIHDSQSKN